MANQTALIGGIVVVIIVIAAIVLYSGNGSRGYQVTTTVVPTTTVVQNTTAAPTTTVAPTGGSNSVISGNTIAPKKNTTTTTTNSSTSVTSSFNVVETEFKITPSALQVVSGSMVTFNITNAGHQTHNFLFVNGITGGIPTLAPGQVQSFTFKAPGPGVYTYLSNFGADNGMGMQGTLTVR